MEKEKRPGGQPSKPSRRTLRLTFKVTDGNFELLSHESLDMITPPQVGERPEAGKHSGLWIELQDTEKRVLAHRVLNAEQLEKIGKFERYRDVDGDGIPYRTLPGTDHPLAAYFNRGSGHNEKAGYTERPDDYENLMLSVCGLSKIILQSPVARAV